MCAATLNPPLHSPCLIPFGLAGGQVHSRNFCWCTKHEAGLWDLRQRFETDPSCCERALVPSQKCSVYSAWGPGRNSPGRNFFYMALFWPIKSASTRGGFELPAVALESKPQTFSSIALVLEKSQMGCLLLAEQIPYYSSQSPPGLLACLDPTLVKPLLQQ